jgi:putative FmdB family regulatory protein
MIRAMPIYEYKCRACGHQFDELVKLGETPNCPSCDKNDLERLFSFPAVSTDRSRKRSFSKARQSASKVHKEKAHAQAEYERNYYNEHKESD